MDIQHLVDRMEALIDEGRHMPFSRFTMIDEEIALEIIDQMRISIPEEIEKAARILAQRDRVLAQANEEAARLLQQAREKGNAMLDQEVTVQAAQNRAANIIEEAQQEAEQIKAEADGYVMQVLGKLEQQLTKNLNIVRNGINEVNHQNAQVQQNQAMNENAQLQQQMEQFSQQNITVDAGQEQQASDERRQPPPNISLKRSDDTEQ